jgi:hypothetical protein
MNETGIIKTDTTTIPAKTLLITTLLITLINMLLITVKAKSFISKISYM